MKLNPIHEFKINEHNSLLRKYYAMLAGAIRTIECVRHFVVEYTDAVYKFHSHREMKKKN